MKHPVSLIFLLISLLLPAAPVQAVDDVVEKTYCTQGIAYESIDALKLDLLNNAKKAVIDELFGEFIVASTAVENFVVTKDQIQTSSLGFVRVEGNTKFHNGNDFADVCVTIRAYVTAEDRAKFNPERLEKKYCDADDNLTTAQLIAYVKDEAVIQALIEYNPKLKGADKDSLLPLVQKVNYLESGFISDTQTYCAKFEGDVVPVEVMAFLETGQESASDPQLIDEDQHLGWAGSVGTANVYLLTVKDYNNKLQYYLKGTVVVTGAIGKCTITNGVVSINALTTVDRVWEWNNNNVNCVEETRPLPQHPNSGNISPKLEQFVRENLLPQGSEFKIDVTKFIKRSGEYTITWEYLSGCCGIFVGGMDLYAEVEDVP